MKKRFQTVLLFCLLFLSLPSWGQQARRDIQDDMDKAGGNYYAYVREPGTQTPPPKGYKPFYISHYGRHGSRYIIGQNVYSDVMDVLKEAEGAGILTPAGEKVLSEMQPIMEETFLRSGDLTELGKKQHHDIAGRMYRNYPGIFQGKADVILRSSTSPRCLMSMMSFGDALRQRNPRLEMHFDTGEKYMDELCYTSEEARAFKSSSTGPWKDEYDAFRKARFAPDSLISVLFTRSIWTREQETAFTEKFFDIASDAQNMENHPDFLSLFTPEDRYRMWEAVNAFRFIRWGNYAAGNGVVPRSASRLLQDFIQKADAAISAGKPSADLRFGHDGNLAPLLCLMGLNGFDVSVAAFEDIADKWQDYNVSPMAANIQLVFFRHRRHRGDVIVKILHNEKEATLPIGTDMFPYYRWSDVRSYFLSRINGSSSVLAQPEYVPSPAILQARQEFQDAKFGVFLHWGIYSMLGRGEWVLKTQSLDADEYRHLAAGFYPSKFDAKEWVTAFKDAGAKYICFTTRHHDGFSMFGSKATPFNVVDATPFHRDVLKELTDECHRQGIKVHFYYSLVDWTRDDYYPLGKSGRDTGRDFSALSPVGGTIPPATSPDEFLSDTTFTNPRWKHYLSFVKEQLTELLTGYGPVGAIWFDGYWDREFQENGLDPETWDLYSIYDLIHRLQPSCMVANNHHINLLPGEDFQLFERDLPGENTDGHSGMDVSLTVPLETCQTMNKSWGYNISDKNYKSPEYFIDYLDRTNAKNANLLLNIGPRPDGTLPEEALDILKAIGEHRRQTL